MRTEPNRSGLNNWNICTRGNSLFSPAVRSVIVAELCFDQAQPEPEILLTIRGGEKIEGQLHSNLNTAYLLGESQNLEGRHCGGRGNPANTRFSLRKEGRDGDPHLRITARRGWDTLSLRGLWGDPPSSTLSCTYCSWVFIVNNQHARDAAVQAA